MKKKFTLLCFFLVSLFLRGQQPSINLGPLPDTVSETSGLIFYNNRLVTHNDSGNTPDLFEIDTVSLAITRIITLTNAENKDWEDITQDDEYIYIGDFGNSNGTRKDLGVYRILKSEYTTNTEVVSERIGFAYEDQSNFSDTGLSDWDAEALFVMGDQLIVMTKQWNGKGTVAYTIPKTPGNHMAKRLDAYDIDGFVTGATLNEESKTLVIVGYTAFLEPFLVQVKGANGSAVFGGEISRHDFDIGQAQVESITHVEGNRYYFSTESLTRENPPIQLAASLFYTKIEEAEQPEVQDEVEQPEETEDEVAAPEETETPNDNEVSEEENQENPSEVPENVFKGKEMILFRSARSDRLHYRLKVDGTIYGMSIFDTSGRQISSFSQKDLTTNEIDISMLGSTIYYFTLYTDRGIISKPFMLE